MGGVFWFVLAGTNVKTNGAVITRSLLFGIRYLLTFVASNDDEIVSDAVFPLPDFSGTLVNCESDRCERYPPSSICRRTLRSFSLIPPTRSLQAQFDSLTACMIPAASERNGYETVAPNAGAVLEYLFDFQFF